MYVNYTSTSAILQLPTNKIPKLSHKAQPEGTLILFKQL